MRLKLRHNRNKKGERVYSIYHCFGKYEKLHKKLGVVPKELAETMMRKESIAALCYEEGIRQNRDIPFDQVCDEFLENKCRPPHKAQRTYEEMVKYAKTIKRLIRKVFNRSSPYRLQNVMIYEIEISSIDSYKVLRKEEGVSNRTINLELGVIRGVIKYALEKNYLINFPLVNLKPLREEQPKRAWIEDAALVQTMIDCADSPSTRLKLRLGFEAGLRPGEILKVKLEGIDVERGILTVYGQKEGRFKEIYLSEDLIRELEPLLTQRHDRGGYQLLERKSHQRTYLFCDDKGQPFKSFKKAFERAKQKAGIEGKLSPHSMRHTFASHLLANGANPVDVSKMLGHRMVSTTLNIYSHSSRESRKRSFEKLPYLRREPAEVIELKAKKR